MGKLAAISACAICLSSCARTAVVNGAVPTADVESHALLTSAAPGESDVVIVSRPAHCREGLPPTPVEITKQFASTSTVAEVKSFYLALVESDEWFYREGTASSTAQILNYSRQKGDQYWELHLKLPKSAGGRFEVTVDAYNPEASCSS